MTIMIEAQAPSEPLTDEAAVDRLIPRPLVGWQRILLSTLVLGLTGGAAWVWSRGDVTPRVSCCDGSNIVMALAADRPDAVTLSVQLDNRGSKPLRLLQATADIPGATVTDIGIDQRAERYPIPTIDPLPIDVDRGANSLVITLSPTNCAEPPTGRGTVRLRLDVINGWLPSVRRELTFALPPADSIAMLGPLGQSSGAAVSVVDAACAMLSR